jgi:hypothetical protein
MGTTDWVLTLILGGILGMIGQGIRVIAGLKKVNDKASAEGKSFGVLFSTSTLSLSLLIGFIAGALAIIGMTGTAEAVAVAKAPNGISRDLIITIIGAGYAGTDFIEGFIKKSLPAIQPITPDSANTDEIDQPAVG